MYKVVIAEDSKPILRNIKSLLESSELPLDIVYTAYNGEEALLYMQSHPADILLTDIRMPKLDGLALIEQALQVCPNLKVVLISSYSDFEYTRKAINLQVFDYLLKPVEQQQLEEVMQRIIDKIKEANAGRQAVLRNIVDMERHADLQLDQMVFEQPMLPMLLCRQPFTSSDKWSLELLQAHMATVCDPHPCSVLPLNHPARFLLLAADTLKERYTSGAAWMEAVQRELDARDLEASAICRYQPVGLDRLHNVYHDLEQCLDQELTLSGPVLLDIDRCFPQHREPDGFVQQFAEMIHQRQKEQYMIKLSELLRSWNGQDVRWMELEHLVGVIAGAFYEAFQELAPEEPLAAEDDITRMLEADSYESFCDQWLAWSEDCFRRLQSLNRKSAEELFEQMNQYIQHHKYSALSINDLALKFHISPSYVSRIIKRYTDQTFVHYFMKLKIEEACRLLQAKPELKIGELSDALSFSDQHYFSRVFKEYVGCSPTEYKERTGSY